MTISAIQSAALDTRDIAPRTKARLHMTKFAALPQPRNAAGDPRCIGVEIEFAGLDLDAVAGRVAARLGGTPGPVCDNVIEVEGTEIGTVRVELDTALRIPGSSDVLRSLAQQVVPVEIVTEPLEPTELPRLDALCADLRAAGARGSRDGVLYGFGVHLNVEITGRDGPFVGHIVQAYACLDAMLRDDMALDATRRLLPFVNAWPDSLVRDLMAVQDPDLEQLMIIYAAHTASRNHGLDLLPLFKWADEAAFARRFTDVKSGARPAFHFRLPESRIDEAGWGLGPAWAQWHLVETVAHDPDRRAAVAAAWCGPDPLLAVRAAMGDVELPHA